MLKIIKSSDEFQNCVKNDALVIVDFFAEWCGPCKLLAPQLQIAADANTDVTFAKVDVDNFEELAQNYNILSVPTLLLIKKGSEVDRKIGYVDSEFISNWIKQNN